MFEIFFFGFLIIAFSIFIAGVIFLIQGPPYVPSDNESAEQILQVVSRYKPKHILDMGSGDGKLVILLAKNGYKVDGIELNPRLVLKSRKSINKFGLSKKATIFWGDFWKKDVSDYDLIVLYAIKHIMPRLEKKLKSELHSGAKIVSNYFVFPSLKPKKRLSRTIIYEI